MDFLIQQIVFLELNGKKMVETVLSFDIFKIGSQLRSMFFKLVIFKSDIDFKKLQTTIDYRSIFLGTCLKNNLNKNIIITFAW